MINPKNYTILKSTGIQGLYSYDDFYEFQLRITDYCNYDCSYCHWKYGNHYDFDDIKNTILKAIENINHDYFRIYFHGGEPTTHPKCREVIEFIFSLNKNIIVELQTNLSVGKKYIQTLIDRFKNEKLEINVSYHNKFIKNFKEFKEKVDLLHDNNILGKIDIMLEHDIEQVDEIIYRSKELLNCDYNKRIELIHGYIDYENTTGLYHELIEKYKDNVHFENYEVTHVDGSKKIYNTNDFYGEGINFKGWICSVGKKYIIINGNGDYYMCCANTLDNKPTGNILKNETMFRIRANNYTVCNWDRCGGEFYIDKFKP